MIDEKQITLPLKIVKKEPFLTERERFFDSVSIYASKAFLNNS